MVFIILRLCRPYSTPPEISNEQKYGCGHVYYFSSTIPAVCVLHEVDFQGAWINKKFVAATRLCFWNCFSDILGMISDGEKDRLVSEAFEAAVQTNNGEVDRSDLYCNASVRADKSEKTILSK